jgi:hypothetical protein
MQVGGGEIVLTVFTMKIPHAVTSSQRYSEEFSSIQKVCKLFYSTGLQTEYYSANLLQKKYGQL